MYGGGGVSEGGGHWLAHDPPLEKYIWASIDSIGFLHVSSTRWAFIKGHGDRPFQLYT